MKTSVQLRQERKEVSDKIEALTQKAKGDNNRSFTEAEMTELRTLTDDEDRLSREIETALTLEKRAAGLAGQQAQSQESDPVLNRAAEKFSLTKLTQELATRSVTGLEKEMIEESAAEARSIGSNSDKGVYLSRAIIDAVFKRTQTAQTGNANLGGSLVPTEKLGFADALWAQTKLDKLGVEFLSGLSANTDLTGFDTPPVAAWAAENATQSPTDATFINRTLRPNLLYSAVDVSWLLKIQSNSSVDAYLLNGMMKSMRIALETAVINGDGTNKPLGILGTSGINTSVAMGTNGGAITLAKVLELVSAIETANANLENAHFLTNFKVKNKMKQTPIDAGSGAMIMAYGNYFGGQNTNVIDGIDTQVTSLVPSNLTKGTASGICSALLFGDFSQVVVAQYGGARFSVDEVSAAMVRTGKYALTIDSYFDSKLKQPAAIGAILDILA